MNVNFEHLAQIAYQAYAARQDWKDHRGKMLSRWLDLPEYIQKAWMAAVDAVLENKDTA